MRDDDFGKLIKNIKFLVKNDNVLPKRTIGLFLANVFFYNFFNTKTYKFSFAF
jgi:hypothetical protein